MVHGMVAVRGTSGADEVHISTERAFRRAANRVTHNDLNISVNGKTFTFPAALVRSINVRLGDGNDTLQFSSDEITRFITRNGKTVAARADWAFEADGGAGNDLLHGSNGVETLRGGPGNDSLGGGLGNDSTYGDEGNDLLTEKDGLDRMDGGAGDDRLVMVFPGTAVKGRYFKAYGGSGTDTIYRALVPKTYYSDSVEVRQDLDFNTGMRLDPAIGWLPL